MGHPLPVPNRLHLFLDLVRQLSPAQTAAAETYVHFAQVAREIFAAQEAFLAHHGLSEGKLAVLQLLHQASHEGCTPSELAAAAGVTRGTMTGLLAGLERGGLVTRAVHPEDARMYTIALTGVARNLFERILPERIARIAAFMSVLSVDEQRQLRALLTKLEEGLPTLNDS